MELYCNRRWTYHNPLADAARSLLVVFVCCAAHMSGRMVSALLRKDGNYEGLYIQGA